MDHYWQKLSEGGDEAAQQCGWLKDKYGVSWQVVPVALIEMMTDPDYVKSQRVTAAMLQMKKLDIAGLRRGLCRVVNEWQRNQAKPKRKFDLARYDGDP